MTPQAKTSSLPHTGGGHGRAAAPFCFLNLRGLCTGGPGHCLFSAQIAPLCALTIC